MATFKFELVSPERLVLSADADQVVVPGTEGDFAVLAGHAPVLSTLRPGVLTVTTADGKAKRLFVRGGFAEVDPSSLTVLAQQVVDLADADRDWIAGEIEAAQKVLAEASGDEARFDARATLDALSAAQG